MKLVDDARNWWKWHSTYFYAVIGGLPEVWLNSPNLQTLLPLKAVGVIAPIIAVLGFYLRIRSQTKAKPERPVVPPSTSRLPPV